MLYHQIMIVNYTEEGWEVITQRCHGLLAAQICVQWKTKERPKRWLETLAAVAEHDDVYNEFENDDLLNDAGGPVNFKQSTFQQDKCERLINMAITRSAYITLLIASHIHFVHGNDPAGKSFFAALKKREKGWYKVSGIQPDEVRNAYTLLQFCDAFSLLLCQNLVQPDQRKIEISEGPGHISYDLYTGENGELHVYPWPFEAESFIIIYESRQLTALTFPDSVTFQHALAGAAVRQHELVLMKDHGR